MFKFSKKQLIHLSVSFAVICLAAYLVPSIRLSLTAVLREPLRIFTFIRREVGAVVFFHRNFVLSERLSKETGILRQQLVVCDEMRLENERLKKLVSFKNSGILQFTAARVIGRSSESWSSAVIIDKGARSGIRAGQAVVTYAGFLGRVIETTGSTSKVLLVSDPNLSVSAMSQRSRQEGLVCGTLGNFLVMRYLPEQADIEPGDTIITSGLNQVYPKGLLVGTVVDAGKDASGLSRRAVIRPAATMYGIEEVLVIIP